MSKIDLECLVRKLKKAAGWCSVIIGTVLAVYVGSWKMIIKPPAGLYLAYRRGEWQYFIL